MTVQRYVELINWGGDYCGMGLASDWPADDDEGTTGRANDDEWVLASDHDTTVIEQQREIERLREALRLIADEQQYRSGYDQTDISVEPILSVDEMQQVARTALGATQ